MTPKALLLPAAIVLLIAGCSGGVDVTRFQILEFNGHTYVAYDGNNFDSGFLHNPDCAGRHKGE